MTAASPVLKRQITYSVSVFLAGMAIFMLCLVPLFLREADPRSLFPDVLQESFFFDLFGWVGGCWLLSWVCALCNWKQMSRVGQWLGIVLLCLAQVILLGIWRAIFQLDEGFSFTTIVGPLLLQGYFFGYFLGFFTMPALTLEGNKRLTGLGTLALLLPWLLGRDAIIIGTQLLSGLTP